MRIFLKVTSNVYCVGEDSCIAFLKCLHKGLPYAEHIGNINNTQPFFLSLFAKNTAYSLEF